MRTEFTKQQFIDLCNEFVSYFGTNRTNEARLKLEKILDIDCEKFDEFCDDITVQCNNLPIIYESKSPKLNHIRVITLTDYKIKLLGGILKFNAIVISKKMQKPIVKYTLNIFVNYLYNICNFNESLCVSFVRDLHESVEDQNN